jgi:hypothetical protein
LEEPMKEADDKSVKEEKRIEQRKRERVRQ